MVSKRSLAATKAVSDMAAVSAGHGSAKGAGAGKKLGSKKEEEQHGEAKTAEGGAALGARKRRTKVDVAMRRRLPGDTKRTAGNKQA